MDSFDTTSNQNPQSSLIFSETTAAEGKSPKKLETKETAKQRKLVQSSALISLESPSPDDMVFMHSVLCQVGLPRRKVEGREFLRTSGKAWLNIQAGVLDEGDGPVDQPLPYGAIPRLAMAHISTHAIRHKTCEIPIGESASEFLDLLGIEKSGKRYNTLRTQMHALAACRMQLGYLGRTYNGQPIAQFDAWLKDGESVQRPIWPGIMVLSGEYYDELLRSGVPLDNRAIVMLKGTALGLDLYAAFAQRLHRIDEPSLFLSWARLKEQFGQEYDGKYAMDDFKTEFKRVLAMVKAAYPQAKVEVVRGGLELKRSAPPIPFKGSGSIR